MVKINQITDNRNKKLLLKIFMVLAIAVICTVSLSFWQKESSKLQNNSIVDIPIIYEYAPIKLITADNQEIWLEIYIEPYTNKDLPKIHKNEQKTRQSIRQRLSTFSLPVLMFPENRNQIAMILKKQVDINLYPTTVKNIRFDLIRP